MSGMKIILKDSPQRGISMSARDIPEPGPREVLIKVRVAGICGTDLHIYKWDAWSQERIKPPVVIGHEFAGEIVKLGSGAGKFKTGQRVSAEGHIICGNCRFCKNGLGHICQNVKIIGVDRDGCFAEYLCIPEENIWPVDDRIPDRYAALFDPLGNAMHTVMTEPVPMKNVIITGAGAIGLFAIPIAKLNGASRVVVIEPNEFKRKLALEVGADLALDPGELDTGEKALRFNSGSKYDRLLEMSGSGDALHLGLSLLGNGGTVSLLGIPSRDISLNLAEEIIFKGITLHGITGRRMYETWYQCESFLLAHAGVLDPIITHFLDLDCAEEGFREMEASRAVKVLLKL